MVLPVEQRAEMLVQQLDVERLRGFVIPVVDPVGGMLDERPEIVVEVEHQKLQAVFFQAFGELDRGGGLAGGTRPAHPDHAQAVAGLQPRQHFLRGLVQGAFIDFQRGGDDFPDAPAADGVVQAGHGVHAVLAVPGEDLFMRSRGSRCRKNFPASRAPSRSQCRPQR